MKKSFAVFLGLALMAISQFALAAPAVVTDLFGTAQATPATGASRALKNGDAINERDTVQTGDKSGLVMRFEDGQIAAMGANARMTVSAYSYDAKEPAKSNVLLSLLTGGMRAITGLIGKSRPDRVSYTAGTATIGIRGTDVTFATIGGNVVVTVQDGVISFKLGNGTPIVVQAGQAVLTQDGRLTQGTIAAIEAILNDPANSALKQALLSVNSEAIQNAVQKAATLDLQPVTKNATVTCGVSCN